MSGWVKISDGLPEEREQVLIRYWNGQIHTGAIINGKWHSNWNDYDIDLATHWMSIEFNEEEQAEETEMYNKGYSDGFDEAVKSEIPKIHPKLKGSDPDYWTRLEHQAAIAAMQGILSNPNIVYKDISTETICNHVADRVKEIAHALVEKYKKEE